MKTVDEHEKYAKKLHELNSWVLSKFKGYSKKEAMKFAENNLLRFRKILYISQNNQTMKTLTV